MAVKSERRKAVLEDMWMTVKALQVIFLIAGLGFLMWGILEFDMYFNKLLLAVVLIISSIFAVIVGGIVKYLYISLQEEDDGSES